MTFDKPDIIQQPSNKTICEGEEVTFTVSAISQAGTLTYQWQKDGAGGLTDIIGATDTTYTFETNLDDDGTQYQVAITDANNCTVISSLVTLNIHDILHVIDIQPIDQTVCEGEEVTFSTSVTNTGGNLSYQWQQVCPGDSFTTYTTSNGLQSNYIADVLIEGGIIYVATWGGGISISSDDGTSWTNYANTDGLASNFVYSIFVENETIYVGTDQGLSISDNDGSTWVTRTIYNGLGNNRILGIYVHENNIYLHYHTSISISNDNGLTWTNLYYSNFSYNHIHCINWDMGILYLGTEGGLYYSSNNGLTWEKYTTANGLGQNRVYGTFIQGNDIYLANHNGGLSYSNNGGLNWMNIPNTNFGGHAMFEISVQNDIIYIGGFYSSLYYSENNGQTWSSYTDGEGLSGNINNLVEIDENLYVATTVGLSVLSPSIVDVLGANSNPYTFTPNLSDNCSQYQLVITDDNGCSITSNLATLDVLSSPSITNTTSTDITCIGQNDGTITISATCDACENGLNDIVYSIDGMNYQTSNVFTDLSPNTYAVSVSNINDTSCIDEGTNQVTISEPPAIMITTAVMQEISCHGAMDGMVWANISGGTPPLSYLWENGSPFANIIFLSGGTYTVTITDANGCIETSSIVLPEPPPITYTAAMTACSDSGLNTGEITITATGGTGALAYSIDNGTTNQSTPVFTGLSEGIYTVLVQDANNCNSLPTTVDIVDCTEACPENYTDTNQLTGTQSTNADYETNGILNSDQFINNNAKVDYDSGTEINLLPGFEVDLGVEFDAFIDGCNEGEGGNQ